VTSHQAFGRCGCCSVVTRPRSGPVRAHHRSGWPAGGPAGGGPVCQGGRRGQIPLEQETLGGLLERWLQHIEARWRAPKTLLENRALERGRC